MSIQVQCSACGKSFEVSDFLAGGQGQCEHCQAVVQIPALGELQLADDDEPEPSDLPGEDFAAPGQSQSADSIDSTDDYGLKLEATEDEPDEPALDPRLAGLLGEETADELPVASTPAARPRPPARSDYGLSRGAAVSRRKRKSPIKLLLTLLVVGCLIGGAVLIALNKDALLVVDPIEQPADNSTDAPDVAIADIDLPAVDPEATSEASTKPDKTPRDRPRKRNRPAEDEEKESAWPRPVDDPKDALKLAFPAENVPWSVEPDPIANASRPFAEAPIPIGVGNIRGVGFSRPEEGKIVVFHSAKADQLAPAYSSSDQELRWITRHDRFTGKMLGRIDLPGEQVIVDVSPSGGRVALMIDSSGNRLDVISSFDGRTLASWRTDAKGKEVPGDSNSPAVRYVPKIAWAGFIDDDHLLVTDGEQQTVAWQLPECQAVYRFGPQRNGKNAAQGMPLLTPARNYLVVCDEKRIRFLDSRSGQLRGDLLLKQNAKNPDPFTRLHTFSPDAQSLVVLTPASKNQVRLEVWDLVSGQSMRQATIEAPMRMPIQWCDETRVMLGGGLGGPGQCMLLDLEQGTAVGTCQLRQGWTTGCRDAQSQWIVWQASPVAEAYLGPVPSLDSPLVEETATIDVRKALGIVAPAGDSLVGPTLEELARQYVFGTYLGVIGGSDSDFEDRLRWIPGVKFPAIGIRWGIAVQLDEDPHASEFSSAAQFADQSGTTGPRILEHLQQLSAGGACGFWPRVADPRFGPVVVLGGGPYRELLEAAQAWQCDGLVLISPTSGANGSGEMRIGLIAVAAERTLWTSAPTEGSPSANLTEEERGAALLAEVVARIDEHFVLTPMPNLKPEHVVGRLETIASTLVESKTKRRLAMLTEVLYYQARQLATVEQVEPLYDVILGPGKGAAFATGTPTARRDLAQDWLDSP